MKHKNQIHNLTYLKQTRKGLRNDLTSAEAYLWTLLRNNQLEGRKFRRQHSVGNYVLDFYCPAEQLAIELDGQGHFTSSGQENDQERTKYLNSVGIRVLRFENKQIFKNSEGVLEAIRASFSQQPPLM